ncbi:30S ribosomal protein S2 [Patescibacteria group bacterium]|nr:30S ribosomal protein S2 [Patescibacteria group bacterium]
MSEYDVPLTELLEAGCHFGHQVRRWNPKMKPYVYAKRDGVHIFDLAKTAEGLKDACMYVKEFAASGKTLLMVGTKRQAKDIVREEAQKAGAPFVTERWLGGTITNWEQIKKSIERLSEMREKREKDEYKKYTKKENVLLNREIKRLERFFGGLVGLGTTPDALFVVDTHREIVAVKEAKSQGISVVGIVDTNAEPEFVDYVIPANDDAVRSIKLIVSMVAQAYADGKRIAEKKKS